MNSIGEYCATYRRSKGVSQSDLGINFKTVSAFENGRSTNIKLLTLYVNIAVLHDEVTQFMNGLAVVIMNSKED